MFDSALTMLQPIDLLFYFFGYLLGSMPTAYLVARVGLKTKIEKRSVKHTASHVKQISSVRSAALVVAMDLIKGLLPCAIAISLDLDLTVVALTGFFSVLGHCFSVWLGFFGGHGGVTASGVLLVIFWPAAVICLLVNWLFILTLKSPGLASILGSLMGALVVFLSIENKVVWLVVAAMTVVIILRHRSSYS